MHSKIYGAGISGIDGFIITIECSARNKIPGFELVGLPDLAVKEAKERVRNACANSGIQFPVATLTVNLAPADKKKRGLGTRLAHSPCNFAGGRGDFTRSRPFKKMFHWGAITLG